MNDQLQPDRQQVLFPNEGEWCDLWHTHVDWKGDGNQGISHRRLYLRRLFQLFCDLETHTANWKTPTQRWIVIDELDSSQDAVYLHTPNPNRDNYPYAFRGVAWNADCPDWLAEFVNPQTDDFGRCVFEGIVTFWLRRKDIA